MRWTLLTLKALTTDAANPLSRSQLAVSLEPPASSTTHRSTTSLQPAGETTPVSLCVCERGMREQVHDFSTSRQEQRCERASEEKRTARHWSAERNTANQRTAAHAHVPDSTSHVPMMTAFCIDANAVKSADVK